MTKTKKAHTPLPWRFQKSEQEPDHWVIYSAEPPSIDIADVRPWVPHGASGEDAAFIVRAVNNFDALLEVAKDAVALLLTKNVEKTEVVEFLREAIRHSEPGT